MKKLFNIFSRPSKKRKPKEKVKIIVDNREKNSLIPSLLSENFSLEYKQLPVADYIVNNTAIERKTLSDLKSSIINKRIIQQLLELKQYPQHLLLLEGFPKEETEGRLHQNALRGFLLSVALEYRVPIIFTEDEEDTVKYISILAKKTEKEYSIRASKISKTKKEQVQFILEGFPYIGPKTSKKLIKKFKSIQNIINASEEELKEILGKRAKDFKKIVEQQIKRP